MSRNDINDDDDEADELTLSRAGGLAQAIALLQETAVAADGAKDVVKIIHPVAGEPHHVYLIARCDGEYERREAPAPARKQQLLSVAEVGPFVTEVTERLDAHPSVWYAPDGLRIVLDDLIAPNLLGHATVALVHTPQFLLLRELEKPRTFSQKQLITLLKAKLGDCLLSDGQELLRALRSINFREQTTGNGVVERGRESLGRQIEAEVTSAAGALPETITLAVRVYTDPVLTMRREVVCAIDCNVNDQTLTIEPLPLQLDDAVQQEMEQIAQLLAAAVNCPVLFGKP